jgi:hypothetical protein
MKSARCFAAFLLILPGLTVCSQAEWPPISPEDLATTSIKEQPGAPAEVLLREETDDEANNVHTVYKRVKILTDAGREYANVEIPYLHEQFTIFELSGRTVHPDGSVSQLQEKVFDKAAMRTGGFQVNVKSFTLPDVQVGSIIDYRYSLRYENDIVLAPDWEVQTELFQRKATFKFVPFQDRGQVQIMLEDGSFANGISWVNFLGNGRVPQLHEVPAGINLSGHKISVWVDLNMENIPAFLEEPHMPPGSFLKWHVDFFYSSRLKPDEYWKAEGKLWSKRVDSFLKKNRGETEALGQVISPADSGDQKVRKIYAFVAKMENQSYIPERTKQEEKTLDLNRDKGAEDVLEHHSGTHDDLNRLFASMVRAAGIPASLIWVPDRSERIFVKELLSTRQFGAEIVIVQLDGKDVFLDPGTQFCPYGIVDWRYTGVVGLRQNEGGADLGQTPVPDYKASVETRVADVVMDEQGVIDGTADLVFKGTAAMTRRHEGGKTDAEGRKRLLEDEMRKMLPGDSDVKLINVPDWDSTETPLVAAFHIHSPFAVAAGKRLMVMQHLFQTKEQARFSAADRSFPVYFHYPWQEVDEVHIKIPSGLEVESLAPDDSVRIDSAVYQVKQKQEAADKLFSRRDFIMVDMIIPQDRYKDLKGFFDKVKADDDQPALVRISKHVATTP